HNDSNTGRHIRSGEEMKYNCFAVKIFQSYLPEAVADKITNQAKEIYSISALDKTFRFIDENDWTAVNSIIKEVLKCSITVKILFKLLKIILYGLKSWFINNTRLKNLSQKILYK
ncbi:MAG TPA: hypothetical protein VLM39_06110, partial [Ignavibacteriaceae bacterium]|nr:hypothetical protein [Ignavibacteriaceae bacterium]